MLHHKYLSGFTKILLHYQLNPNTYCQNILLKEIINAKLQVKLHLSHFIIIS